MMSREISGPHSQKLLDIASSLVGEEDFKEARRRAIAWQEECQMNEKEGAIVMAALCIGAIGVLEACFETEESANAN